MLPLDDARWCEYRDAMGVRYDLVPILRQLLDAGANESIWDACWNHLVYQDSVGQASYAAVPYLAAYIQASRQINWNALALVAAIELARPSGPPVPQELDADYRGALRSIPTLLAQHPQTDWDDVTTRCAVSCIALARGQPQLGRVYFEMSLDEAIAWSEGRKNKGE
jgi:hypothetical protein